MTFRFAVSVTRTLAVHTIQISFNQTIVLFLVEPPVALEQQLLVQLGHLNDHLVQVPAFLIAFVLKRSIQSLIKEHTSSKLGIIMPDPSCLHNSKNIFDLSRANKPKNQRTLFSLFVRTPSLRTRTSRWLLFRTGSYATMSFSKVFYLENRRKNLIDFCLNKFDPNRVCVRVYGIR